MTEKTGDDLQLSKRAVKSVMKEESDRVSDDAAIRLAGQVEQFIKAKTRAGDVIAESDGRKTVREADIRAAERVKAHLDEVE